MEWTLQLAVLRDAAIAMALGGAVGFERELKNRPAGFRTHMLVAGAAALLVGMGQLIVADGRLAGRLPVALDPFRLVEAVIAGMSFIGAGTVFAHRGTQVVVGLTTAASLLMVAVIGTLAGFGYHLLAAAAMVLTLAVLSLIALVERRMLGKRPAGRPDAPP